MHRFLLHNDDIRDAHEKILAPGQVGLLNGWGVFSTLRVQAGVLFAYERHWKRMQCDAKRMRVPFPDHPEWLRERLLKLVEANQAHEATLRVVIVRNRQGPFEGPDQNRDFDVIAFTTDLADWGDSARLALKSFGRFTQYEFSGAKVLSWSHNLTWLEEARERGFDEVLLLNERGEVSECTSANILAAYGREVHTPPLNSGCLPGVTRELLLEKIHVPGIQVLERTLFPADLERADQVFITSSTRDVLPVTAIDGLKIRNEGFVMDELARAFREYRNEYVQANAANTKVKV